VTATVAAKPRYLRPASLVVVLIIALPWTAVPWGCFQFDDFDNLVHDPATVDPGIFFAQFFERLRPLTRLSYILDARLWDLVPAAFLTTNLVLHLATTLLVFALARRLFSLPVALVAALVFSLQPANAEVVAYASGRSTGLMTPLLLCALLLHDRGARPAALAFFFLACLAKEAALVFPLLVAVWETGCAPQGRRPMQSIALYTGGAAGILVALLSSSGYRNMIDDTLLTHRFVDNLLANGRAVPEMLSLWFRPWALSADHDFDSTGSIALSVIGLLVLGTACVAAVAFRRRAPLSMLACVWPIVALLPTNSLLSKLDVITEKPLYLAWVGPAIAIGYGAIRLHERTASQTVRRNALALGVVLLGAGACACAWRVAIWSDPTTLWLDATAKAPQKSRCWSNLGMAHFVAGRYLDAQDAFIEALRRDPLNRQAEANLARVQLVCGAPCRPGARRPTVSGSIGNSPAFPEAGH